ncbi:MAG: radical SAM-associated putative lipoprotein [Paludibacteraceae bacterium]
MKTLRKQTLRRLNMLWGALLSLLGLTMCSTAQMRPTRGNIMAKYGIPLTEYRVAGRVLNEQGQPQPNVEVRIANTAANPDTTDTKGRFEVVGVQRAGSNEVTLVCTPLNDNAGVVADSVQVPIQKTERDGLNTKASAKKVKVVLKK